MRKVYHILLYLLFILSFAATLFVSLKLYADSTTSETNAEAGYTINYKSGFYNHSLKLNIETDSDVQVYYSLDGTEPARDLKTSALWDSPIKLHSSREEQTYHIRFRLYYADGSESAVFDYSYVLGYFVKDRYDTYVVHISGDPDGLFGYENGVFVSGKLRDDFLMANPDIEEAYNMDPANYNLRGRESERAVNLQIFDSNGSLLLSQNCGLRIFGNFSRGKLQKSFQLFARSSYDVHGKFHVALFPDLINESDGTIMSRSNRLVFRNSGNDFGQAFVRDTLVQDLAVQLGFPYSTPYVPAAVYINNEYYGFYWVKEPFSNGYMEDLYGSYNGSFEKVTINEFYKTANDETEVMAPEYQEILNTYCDLDMSDDTNYENLIKFVDIDNYLQYYAIELYIANKDWPYNNVRAYRYVAEDGNYTEGTVFDGRYRYLLFDTDYAFGLSDDAPGFAADEDNISVLLNNVQSPMFCALMAREDCRDKFVTYMCDLMNDAFAYDNLKQTLEKICAQRENELNYYVSHSLTDVTTVEGVNAATDSILQFTQNRVETMHGFLQNDYAMFHPYTLQITAPKTSDFSVNSIASASAVQTDTIYAFSGTYYGECDLTLTAKVNSGHEFAYWLINGAKYEQETLTLTSADLSKILGIAEQPAGETILPYTQTLDVELVETDYADALPIISQLHVKGSNDVVSITNPSDHAISLDGFYLSDQADALKLSKLPAHTLAPGETVDFYGSSNILAHSGSQNSLDFNLRKYETLYFSTENGTILEAIPIPDMTFENSYYTRDLFTGIFTEQLAD